MTRTFKKFLACESGATALEYGLLVGALSVAVIASLDHIGDGLSSTIGGAGDKIAEKVNGISPAAGK